MCCGLGLRSLSGFQKSRAQELNSKVMPLITRALPAEPVTCAVAIPGSSETAAIRLARRARRTLSAWSDTSASAMGRCVFMLA